MTQRTPSPVDAIAEDYFHRSMALSPIDATHQGEPGHDHLLDDFSPAGYAARAALRQETLAALAAATPVDDIDRVTLKDVRARVKDDQGGIDGELVLDSLSTGRIANGVESAIR